MWSIASSDYLHRVWASRWYSYAQYRIGCGSATLASLVARAVGAAFGDLARGPGLLRLTDSYYRWGHRPLAAGTFLAVDWVLHRPIGGPVQRKHGLACGGRSAVGRPGRNESFSDQESVVRSATGPTSCCESSGATS